MSKYRRFLLTLCTVILFAMIRQGSFPEAFTAAGAFAADYENYTCKLAQSTVTYILWTTPPSERVFKDSTVPADTGSGIKVYAAKNESEPFQVVVKPASSGAVTVNIGDFGSGI